MGFIIDKETAKWYADWYHSPQGRAIDRSIEKLILALLRPMPGERVLDIGCGTANHLLIFNKLGLDVSGIDASPYMIAQARARLGRRCTLQTGLAENLPFEDNQFDLAVMINTLEFLQDPVQALMEAGRVAKRKVFIGVLNSLSWNGLLNRMKGYMGDPLFSRARFYNLWQVKSLLRMAFGPVPVSWQSIRTSRHLAEEVAPFLQPLCNWKNSPFGSFLGISATMVYRLRTNNLPLKVRLKKASQSLIGVNTLEDINRSKGDHGDERGIAV